MGQAEIQKILLSNKKTWFSTTEIQIKLNQKASVVTRALRKMKHYNEVKRKQFMIKRVDTHYPVFLWRIS